MKSVVVLGGTGFVGQQVCKLLLEHGRSVTVPTRKRSLQHPAVGVTLREVDVHDEQALTQVLAEHDAVINLVAILHGDAAAFESVHVALPRKLVRACVRQGVARVVHVSALGVNDMHPERGPSEYLRSKGRGEAVLLHAPEAAGLDVTVLRPSVIFGAGDKFLTMFAKLQSVFPVMPLAGANAKFQPVWVEDVALAVVRALERSPDVSARVALPRIIEACGPDVYTLVDLVRLSARLSGVRGGAGRPVFALPGWMARAQARMMELAPGVTLMSRDNLDSMKVDNVASGTMPGLEALGITPEPLEPIAARYLGKI
jgi:NADH dehydrogenase